MGRSSVLFTVLLVGLVLIVTGGCASVRTVPALEYAMPEPFANPRYGGCTSLDLAGYECVTMPVIDFNMYLDDLVMFCEATGNDPEQCDVREE